MSFTCQYFGGCSGIKMHESEYCHAHICHYRNGNKYRCVKMRSHNSIFCEEHLNFPVNCEQDTCEECTRLVVYGSNYCEHHKCAERCCPYFNGIHEQCYDSDDTYSSSEESFDEERFCPIHKCCVYGCTNRKFLNWKMCQIHQCRHPGCHEVAEAYSCCDKHRCEICKDKRGVGRFCFNHTCSYKDCTNMADYKSPYSVRHCREHNCKHDGCNNIICEGFEYCDEHMCTCADCNNYVQLGKYCEQHKCKIEKCFSMKEYMSDACAQHQCIVEGCRNIVVDKYFGKYCNVHTCEYEHSNHTRCYHPKAPNSKFCEIHKCIRCENKVCEFSCGEQSRVCVNHKCKYVDYENINCIKAKKDGYEFCGRHCCLGCGKQKDACMPSCGKECSNPKYAHLAEISEMFETHKSIVDIKIDTNTGYIKIVPSWCTLEPTKIIKIHGDTFIVDDSIVKCSIDGCENLAFPSATCCIHSD